MESSNQFQSLHLQGALFGHLLGRSRAWHFWNRVNRWIHLTCQPQNDNAISHAHVGKLAGVKWCQYGLHGQAWMQMALQKKTRKGFPVLSESLIKPAYKIWTKKAMANHCQIHNWNHVGFAGHCRDLPGKIAKSIVQIRTTGWCWPVEYS